MAQRTVLVIGGGGREHALSWALARSPQVKQIWVAPGNAGTEWSDPPPAGCVPLAVNDLQGLLAFAQEKRVDLTVVGPEVPLAAGLVDLFREAGQLVFGPTRAAARLESSKAYAKAFMATEGIPTAAYQSFTDYEAARDYLTGLPAPPVIKASGLAAGKGVIVCQSPEQAQAALRQMMVDNSFGAAGREVVIEERLEGPELSLLAFSDGQTARVMPPTRDHKRLLENDQGPNTGGMGAYAPAPDATETLINEAMETIIQPALAGLSRRGHPYVGVLYAGLILTKEGIKTLEFNCRFGDPETQVILPLLETDLVEIMLACIEGRLQQTEIHWRAGACATVVMAAPGYPGSYPTGLPLSGLEEAAAMEEVLLFHAGTARRNGKSVTAGGRVLNVTAVGHSLPAALARAYTAVEAIHFEGVHYRRDIGKLT